jgi:hypothetical protein
MSHCPFCDLRALGGRQTVGTKGAREVGTNDIIGCILVDDEHLHRKLAMRIKSLWIYSSRSWNWHPENRKRPTQFLSLVQF